MILLPAPRKTTRSDRIFAVPSDGEIVCHGQPGAIFPSAGILQSVLPAGIRWDIRLAAGKSDSGAVTLGLADIHRLPAQGYCLNISPAGVSAEAGDAAGLFYAVMTLRQIFRQYGRNLPCCRIEDWPDFPSRGVMLDISRDKVPTLDTLFSLVDQLAEWKINHLELYMEHTFAYRGHREVWAQASPMTGEDILRLDAYCRQRFVELVPCQNSFGHMARWLRLPAYRHLAECPETADGSTNPEPNTLSPVVPESLAFLDNLYAELLPHFTSGKFNIGCDETCDLGQGKSKALCDRRGKGRVYLDFLLKLQQLVKKYGRTALIWGDIITQHPELVAELPRDLIVLEWGYEASHPFDEHGARFAASGIPFFVCPGTSGWRSIAGRTENSLTNLRNAARYGLKHGAAGYLNTDWGDLGHWQYLPVSYPGFAAGAAFSWDYKVNRALDLKTVLNTHVFFDAAGVMGGLAYDLGNAYLHTGRQVGNASVLFNILHESAAAPALPAGVSVKTLNGTREFIKTTMKNLSRAAMNRPDAGIIQAEFANAALLMIHACERGRLLLGASVDKAVLSRDMRTILGEHRRLWMARNREGGLHDSAGVLEQRLREYEKLINNGMASQGK